jgi:hypothetical protein
MCLQKKERKEIGGRGANSALQRDGGDLLLKNKQCHSKNTSPECGSINKEEKKKKT